MYKLDFLCKPTLSYEDCRRLHEIINSLEKDLEKYRQDREAYRKEIKRTINILKDIVVLARAAAERSRKRKRREMLKIIR